MSRTLEARLRKLEQAQPRRVGRWHRISARSEAEMVTKRAELMASATWADGDNIIERLIVSPLTSLTARAGPSDLQD